MLIAIWWLRTDWPEQAAQNYPCGIVLCSAEGEIIRVKLSTQEVDCRPTYSADAKDWIVKAVVAAEDATFWSHWGVSLRAIGRAALQNSIRRSRVSGASTISMQTIRLLKPHPKNLLWKCKEALMAIKLELSRDKIWILTQYLNRAPFGGNLVGIEAAAQGFLGKSAKELGLGDAALLAGILQAPSFYRPDRHLARAMARRNYVLDQMLRQKVITKEQWTTARSSRPCIHRSARPFHYPHFTDWVLRSYQLPASVHKTTLDPSVQDTLQKAIDLTAKRMNCSVSAVAIRVKDSAILGMACSGDYRQPPDGQVNTATTCRPSGSTLKPFLVAQLLNTASVTPYTLLPDQPRSYQGYRPVNFDGHYRGEVTLREALILSLNIPFTELLQRSGIENFARILYRCRLVDSIQGATSLGLGLMIGNAEVNLLDLTNAYATFARGGTWRPYTAIVGESPSEEVRIFTPESAYQISEMLSGDERSYSALGHNVASDLPRFAWKTGTSAAYRDAWTILWNPKLVVGVWCGHKRGFGDQRMMGTDVAAPTAWSIARQLSSSPAEWFAPPNTLTNRLLCKISGLPANSFCPSTQKGRVDSTARLCYLHHQEVRTTQGKRFQPPDLNLRFLQPEDGATYRLIGGDVAQRIVCQIATTNQPSRLWWFADGSLIDEGTNCVKSLTFPPGKHRLTVTTDSGCSATTTFTILQAGD